MAECNLSLPCLACARELARIDAERAATDRRLTDAIISIHRGMDQASAALEIRLEIMNNFRSQILEERGNYVLRVSWDSHIKEDEVQHNIMRDFIANFQGRVWGVAVMIGMVGTIAATVINKLWK